MELDYLLLLSLIILTLAYIFARKKFNYWKDRGVPFVPPSFPFGNLGGVGSTTTLGERIREHYVALKGKGVIGGLFFYVTPIALVTDLDLLRNIFVKDFQYFQSRGVYCNEERDPISAHLFNIEGDKWKNLRSKMTSAFTPGKMRAMHSTVMAVADRFSSHLRHAAEMKTIVDFKQLCGMYTTDIIGNLVYGLDCNSMKDPDNEFRRYGKRFFEPTQAEFMKEMFATAFPKVAKSLGLILTNESVSQFFMETTRKTVEYRKKNNIQRNDFLQQFMEIQSTEKVNGEAVKLSLDELAAQTFAFFAGGFETSAATMTFALYEMALNPEVQNRARVEIKEVLDKYNQVLSYEAAQEMVYMDQIIQETLRKYPVGATLRRKVHETYQVPNTNITLEKDIIVRIPVLAIHHDPEIYCDPETFDPDRFTKENISQRHPYSWIPFGEGPRGCIALRFGMLQARVGLATLLKSYRIVATERTPIPIRFQPHSNVLTSSGQLFLRIETV